MLVNSVFSGDLYIIMFDEKGLYLIDNHNRYEVMSTGIHYTKMKNYTCTEFICFNNGWDYTKHYYINIFLFN